MINAKNARRLGITVLLFLSMFLALFFILAIGVHLAETSPGAVVTLTILSEGWWLLLVRLVIYATLWFGWHRIVRYFKKDVSEAAVHSSRRPLLVLILVYEFLFASNVPGLLTGLL